MPKNMTSVARNTHMPSAAVSCLLLEVAILLFEPMAHEHGVLEHRRARRRSDSVSVQGSFCAFPRWY